MTQHTEELPGYVRGEPLYESAVSLVYRAQRTADGACVVIKRSRVSSLSARQLIRYRNEYDVLSSLDCDGVVRVYELVRHEGAIALVLEDLPGCSLRRWIERRPDATLAERLNIAIRLAETLGAVHAAGVIHKDVTSHNVVYDEATRRCTLIDFGLATRLRTESSPFRAPAALEGTLAYIAPEQTGRMNRSLDYRADLYSLGVTLYELFTGAVPFESPDALEMVHFQLAGQPMPPAVRNPALPEVLSEIVMKLLEKEPERRYRSGAGLAADLRRCLAAIEAGQPVEPFPLGAADVAASFSLPQKLYGRAAQSRVILQSFGRVADGAVEAVYVSGPAGIGKSALVQEIYQPVTHRRGYCIAGKFDQHSSNVPFSGLVMALQDLMQQLLTESEESIAEWRDEIIGAVGANGRLLIDVVPAVGLIIGPQPDVPTLEAAEAQNRFTRAFLRLVQVFCKREHPLVLVLDDAQWADAASLQLVTLLLSSQATEALLVVTTYRDSDIQPGHPLPQAVEEQMRQGVRVHRLELAPLELKDVTELVAETLCRDAPRSAPLAAAVLEKTGGNPFFVRQFLDDLYAAKLIYPEKGGTQFGYDLAAVKAAEMTENVAELLAAKLASFPEETRAVLRAAAAIGNRFELVTLANVVQKPPAQTASLLQPAMYAGLLVPQSDLVSLDLAWIAPLVYSRFAFQHSRVQQASYAELAPEERSALHLAIGRALLAADGDADSRLFDVVDHFNRAGDALQDLEERRRVADLDLRAAARARDTAAYALAVRCLRHAIALLGPDAWQTEHTGMFEAHLRLAQCLELTTQYTAALAVIDSALEHTQGVIERGKLLTQRVIVYLGMGRMPEALRCGREAARLFAVELPEGRDQIRSRVQNEIRSILERTAQIDIEQLLARPRMTDPVQLTLMGLLTHCLPASYPTDQDSYSLICCTMVRLSLDHGHSSLSARAYSSFAALLASGPRRYRDAYRFARLGIELAHKLEDPSVLPSVYFLCASFSSHWIKPIEESIELFGKAIKYGLETGDHLHAGFSIVRRLIHQQFRGAPLADLHAEGTAALEFLRNIGDVSNTELLPPRLRLIEWLQGRRPHGGQTLRDAQDEESWTATIVARGNKLFVSDWFVQLLQHRFHGRDYAAAYEFAKRGEAWIEYSAALVTRVEHTMFLALTIAALYAEASPAQRVIFDAELGTCREQLKTWAEHCPANYKHAYLLVEAEVARLAGARIDAADRYDRAINAARDHAFVNYEALASELAARFWFADQKMEFGGLYLDKALHAYEVWGAYGKAADLRAEHGVGRPQRGQTLLTVGGSTTLPPGERDALDLATVLKASQAIASEIVLERLIAALMDIIMENAGADSVALVLESDGEFLVQGVKRTGEPARVLTGEPLRQSIAVSRGIANYVIRTSEHVVLDDPAVRGQFRNDAYVRNRRPKSVLCAPVINKGKLLGLVYLENNKVSGAFTPQRLEALQVLMTQIAVSIENATLYAKQEQQSRAIEAANVKLTSEIAERVRAEQELNRYKDHLEELVRERTRELEKAQGRLVDISRRAGMAEVASGVLHNVGNVMNSVNVGASVVRDAIKALPVEGVLQASEMLERNEGRLADFLTADVTGKKLPTYLRKLGAALAEEKRALIRHLDQLEEHLEHMKKIIAAQQSYARATGVNEVCTLEEIAEAALAINGPALRGSGILVVRQYAPMPPVLIDRHRIMQILVNLISNAKHALEELGQQDRELKVSIAPVDGGVRIEVRDNGIGIPEENFPKIFTHGFTTKKNGHGFGLHNCANAAQELHGSLSVYSEGRGRGASFVLRIPVEYAEQRSGYGPTGAVG